MQINMHLNTAGRLALLAVGPVIVTATACGGGGLASPMTGDPAPAADASTSEPAPPSATQAPTTPARTLAPCKTENLQDPTGIAVPTGNDAMMATLKVTNAGPDCTISPQGTFTFTSSQGAAPVAATVKNLTYSIKHTLKSGAATASVLDWTGDYVSPGSHGSDCADYDSLDYSAPGDGAATYTLRNVVTICGGKVNSGGWGGLPSNLPSH